MLQVNSRGRTFVKGKSASEELRRSIIDSVVKPKVEMLSVERCLEACAPTLLIN